ncbi:MAG: murein transglycosylase A [Nitrospinota bacterium]|nr:murein transglycosylase A [Nitrospinota bacterium]
MKIIRRRSPLGPLGGIFPLLLALSGCATFPEPSAPDRISGPVHGRARLILERTAFEDLPGWRADRHAEVLPVFRKSCERLHRQPDRRPIDGKRFAGRVADWRAVCAEAAGLEDGRPGDHERARAFFEKWFIPYRAANNGESKGLFTAYYEPVLRGSRTRGGPYLHPLYNRPKDLVTVDLGQFQRDLRGRRIFGKVEDGRLRPYDDRAAINTGALEGRGLEIVWVDDPVAAFFLHVQGSGRVILEDGTLLRIGYDGQNGHAYRSIGRELIRTGALAREGVTLQSIRAWVKDHPKKGRALLETNRSYIFFREIEGDGPIGAQGVALTALRSLAVDRRFIPLGVPIWLDTHAPAESRSWRDRRPLRRLFIAQDTGGAIRGPVRGDIFWGTGDRAEAYAGRMKHPGAYYLLLPRSLGRAAFPAL